ncbi:MAG: cytochrome c [Acidobacteriaceae bacterium]|nr:cytochrome c [Acidobacteriaceae bacterium]
MTSLVDGRSRISRATRGRVAWAVLPVAVVVGLAAADDRAPYGKESITRGRTVYLQNCQDCHGDDGTAKGSAIAVAPDLTDPSAWKFTKTDSDIFSNIKNGAGDNMPPFGPLGPGLKDSEIWDLVNYIRSLGPERLRPRP